MAALALDTLSITDLWSLFDRTGFAISRLRSMELAKSGLTIEQASILFKKLPCVSITLYRY